MLLAASAPTYLGCSLDENGHLMKVDVAVYESDRQAVLAQSTGRTVTRPAVITPSDVSIADDESVWTIDRVTLAFTRRIVIGDREWLERGKCEVKPVPADRAF